ncbi:MAG: phosphatase PAP2 family protein [Prevotellaceae bacterium]|jgi:membrane-associated phospholipid phosphatase|nr:phosphatase PAP2 family protein [Prevotellaceae bacterium]
MNNKFINKFNAAEWASFAYGLVTACYILIFYKQINNPAGLLFHRAVFFTILILMIFISERLPLTAFRLIRYLFPFALISYWYPETYWLNNEVIIPNLDKFFDNLDRVLFGCSPAMAFSRLLPSAAVSEIMYFGYFSYFLIFLILLLLTFFKRQAASGKIMFLLLCSFFIFYMIFIFIPVAGPQFYYSPADSEVPAGYFFSALMRGIQQTGEQPTGAFPSSHVGMTLIAVWLVFKHFRRLFCFVLPVAIILIASTVYIKAHYLIDVIAAFVVSPMIYCASKHLYRFLGDTK